MNLELINLGFLLSGVLVLLLALLVGAEYAAKQLHERKWRRRLALIEAEYREYFETVGTRNSRSSL